MVNVPISSAEISGINYITFFCVLFIWMFCVGELVIDWFIVEW